MVALDLSRSLGRVSEALMEGSRDRSWALAPLLNVNVTSIFAYFRYSALKTSNLLRAAEGGLGRGVDLDQCILPYPLISRRNHWALYSSISQISRDHLQGAAGEPSTHTAPWRDSAGFKPLLCSLLAERPRASHLTTLSHSVPV